MPDWTTQQVEIDRGLRGMLTEPVDGAARLLLVCYPLFEERKSVQRPLAILAQLLTSHGWGTLRFDYQGTGESDGSLSDFDLSSCLDDATKAAAWLRHRAAKAPLSVMAVRTGAPIALELSQRIDCHRLILWEPTIDGRRFLNAKLREHLMRCALTAGSERITVRQSREKLERGETVDVGGYPLTSQLAQTLWAITPDTVVPSPASLPPTLCVNISASPSGTPALQAWCESLQQAGHPVSIDALHAPPFWNQLGVVDCEDLIRVTQEWMNETGKPLTSPQSQRHPSEELRTSAELEQPATINSDAHPLQAVYHRSSSPEANTVVVFFHGWSGSRLGPHRMFVRACRRLASEEGMHAVRFDFRGRGDSPGNTLEASIATMTRDGLAVLDWVHQQLHPERVFLVGICSGCKVAIGVAAEKPGSVDGLALWSPEPMGRMKTSESQRAKSKAVLLTYGRKLFRLESWKKLVRREVNTAMVRRALEQGEVASAEEIATEENALDRFSAFGGDLLTVHGTSDPESALAAPRYTDYFRTHGIRHRAVMIEGANHSYYALDWEAQVLDATATWLRGQISPR